MGPKTTAAVRFVRQTGKRAVIASISHIEKAVQGHAGTDIVPD
jgi:carbamate kinase